LDQSAGARSKQGSRVSEEHEANQPTAANGFIDKKAGDAGTTDIKQDLPDVYEDFLERVLASHNHRISIDEVPQSRHDNAMDSPVISDVCNRAAGMFLDDGGAQAAVELFIKPFHLYNSGLIARSVNMTEAQLVTYRATRKEITAIRDCPNGHFLIFKDKFVTISRGQQSGDFVLALAFLKSGDKDVPNTGMSVRMEQLLTLASVLRNGE
jgi:hypothetical protein